MFAQKTKELLLFLFKIRLFLYHFVTFRNKKTLTPARGMSSRSVTKPVYFTMSSSSTVKISVENGGILLCCLSP